MFKVGNFADLLSLLFPDSSLLHMLKPLKKVARLGPRPGTAGHVCLCETVRACRKSYTQRRTLDMSTDSQEIMSPQKIDIKSSLLSLHAQFGWVSTRTTRLFLSKETK